MRPMKDSGIAWIGKIPEGWRAIKFKYFYIHKKEIAGDRADDYERLALTLNGVIKRPKDDSEGLQPGQFDGYQILQEDDFVFKMIDLQNISTSRVGLSAYKGLVSPAYIRFSSKGVPHSRRFFYYFLMSLYYNCVYNNLGGDGVRSALNANDLGDLIIPITPLVEQQAIADYLDEKCAAIDKLIDNQKAQIEKMKEYKQSVIAEAVTKGLNPSVPMKDSGIEWIGKIPEGWGEVMLSSLFCEHKQKNEGMQCNNLLSLSYGKIIRKSIDTSEGLLPGSFEGYNIIDKGDIVLRLTDLQNDHKSLRTGLATERGIITSAYVTIRLDVNEIASSKYMHYFLHSFDVAKGFYGMGDGVRQSLPFEGCKKITLLLPPLAEQQAIADYLDEKCAAIDKLIAVKQAKIDKLNDYKKSLIYEYVTGKREVL